MVITCIKLVACSCSGLYSSLVSIALKFLQNYKPLKAVLQGNAGLICFSGMFSNEISFLYYSKIGVVAAKIHRNTQYTFLTQPYTS